jgi:hypothetical protein
VILGNDAGETWPDEIDVFVTPDDQGRWCWDGVIPTELQSNEIGTLGERRPITSGVYLIRAESFGTVFAQGTLEIVIGR